ncbi:MAG: Chitinase [Fibrobacteres bacterium]|nr:Chitinase [Fibrobacterota bacterium]
MRFPAAILLLALTAWPQVRILVKPDSSSGPGARYPTVTACNETPATLRMEGWKFRTRDSSAYTTWMPGLTRSGSGPVQYTQMVPVDQSTMPAGRCSAVQVDYSGTQAAGKDISLYEPQALIKVGSCNATPVYQDPPSLTCSDLITAGDYYGNKCVETGARENRYGGFIATFAGQTQIQAGLPTLPESVGGSVEMKWDPRSLGGPQYMMSLAMVQEFFQVDMRFLAAVAGVEVRFGYVQNGKEYSGSISEIGGFNTDQSGTFSPWELEVTSFDRVMSAYPKFFPGPGDCLNRFPDITSGASCLGKSGDTTAPFYMRTPGLTPTRTGINSPQLANGAVSAALTWYGLYDALVHSTDLYFTKLLAGGKDPRAALSAMTAGYMQGIYSGFADPLKDPNIVDNPSASNLFLTGSGNYRITLFKLLDGISNATAASTACGGAIPIYDASIAFSDVQRFFFGGSGAPGTPAAQGDGGLLLHFDLATEERENLLAALHCAFDRLKGRAPSTAGKDAVSYRYDWLAMLRVAKGMLPDRVRPFPVEHDYRYLMETYSKNPLMASGKPKDAAYPTLDILSPLQNQVMAPGYPKGFPVTVKGSDGSGDVKAEWTLDPQWETWSRADSSGGGQFSFSVPCGSKRYPKPGQKGALWIRVVDGCGNATVEELDFTAHAAALCQDPSGLRNAARGKRENNSRLAKGRASKSGLNSGRVWFETDSSSPGSILVDVRGQKAKQEKF